MYIYTYIYIYLYIFIHVLTHAHGSFHVKTYKKYSNKNPYIPKITDILGLYKC